MEETAKIIDACVMATGTSPEEWDNNEMGAKEADCEPNKGATEGETAGLTVSIPIEKVKVGNLTALIDSKARPHQDRHRAQREIKQSLASG